MKRAADARTGLARTVVKRLGKAYPGAKCALDHRTPFELLVATILSAQCTDVRVNLVTPALFAPYPDARRRSPGRSRRTSRRSSGPRGSSGTRRRT